MHGIPPFSPFSVLLLIFWLVRSVTVNVANLITPVSFSLFEDLPNRWYARV